MTNDHWWGLLPPKDAQLAWGARAIMKQGKSIELLHDRVSWHENEDGMRALAKTGLIGTFFEKCKLLNKEYLFDPRKREEHVIVDNWWCKGVVNTNGSHGYLYMCFYVKPLADVWKWGDDNNQPRVPKVGEKVRITRGWQQGREVTTLALVECSGWLHCIHDNAYFSKAWDRNDKLTTANDSFPMPTISNYVWCEFEHLGENNAV